MLSEEWFAACDVQPVGVSGDSKISVLEETSSQECRGGLFAGKVLSTEEAAPEGGRFDPKSNMGKMYRARYLKEGYLKALEVVKAAAVCSSNYLFWTVELTRWIGQTWSSSYRGCPALVSTPFFIDSRRWYYTRR